MQSEFLHIAIGLGFGFVAADDCHDLLCVPFVHLRRTRTLSLRVHRYDGDRQNGNEVKRFEHVYFSGEHTLMALIADSASALL